MILPPRMTMAGGLCTWPTRDFFLCQFDIDIGNKCSVLLSPLHVSSSASTSSPSSTYHQKLDGTGGKERSCYATTLYSHKLEKSHHHRHLYMS